MPAPTVVIVDQEGAFLDQMQHILIDTQYQPIVKHWTEDAPAAIVRAHPDAVVVNLPGDCPQAWEAALLAMLHDDPAIHHIPVVVCSENPAVLQSVVKELHTRTGTVIASSSDPDEVRAKLKAAC